MTPALGRHASSGARWRTNPSLPFTPATCSVPTHFAPEGGESLIALRARILATTHRLASQHIGGLVVLVAHGGVLDVLYRLATGQELQAPRTWQLTNTAINRLLWTPEGLSLVGWADTGHLENDSLDETSA